MTADDRANILVVDDLPAKLLSLETILQDLGQNVVTARSGRGRCAGCWSGITR
jgi:CheY-like chemotaxis protein